MLRLSLGSEYSRRIPDETNESQKESERAERARASRQRTEPSVDGERRSSAIARDSGTVGGGGGGEGWPGDHVTRSPANRSVAGAGVRGTCRGVLPASRTPQSQFHVAVSRSGTRAQRG